MRKLNGMVLLALLLPAALAAQRVGAPGEQVGRKVPVFLTAEQAQSAAVQAVRGALQKGTLLHTWPMRSDGGGAIPPVSVKSAGALFNPTGGKDGTGAYVVGIASPNAKGHVRVVVDGRSGAILDTRVGGSWDWGNSPDWWVKGLNSPPPMKTNSPPPARSN
ncbi:MAG TPA: hypothetical protein VF832_18230 [Longimicrobiales bacterium]